ncbi:hypothetical protein BC833DRAFT_18241 [Globomyces pollinis-pini]|nr:hypothetical protein BC833DRAFT_18241 [Globomyces pollinis-pini]
MSTHNKRFDVDRKIFTEFLKSFRKSDLKKPMVLKDTWDLKIPLEVDTIRFDSKNRCTCMRLYDSGAFSVTANVYSIQEDYNSSDKLQYEAEGNVLTINYNDPTPPTLSMVNPYVSDYQYCDVMLELLIYIPKEFRLYLEINKDGVVLFNHGCKLLHSLSTTHLSSLQDLNLNELKITVKTHDIRLQNIRAKKMSLKADLGCLILKDIHSEYALLDSPTLIDIDSSYFESIYIKSPSADFNFTDSTLRNSYLCTKSGIVTMNDMKFHQMKLLNRSGSVTLSDCQGKSAKLNMRTSNFSATDMKLESLIVMANSGTVNMKNCSFTVLDLNLVYGDILLEGIKSHCMKMLTDSGSIQLIDFVSTTMLSIQSNSSNIKISGKFISDSTELEPKATSLDQNDRVVLIRTISGKIESEISEYRLYDVQSSNASIIHRFNGKPYQLTKLETTDGDILVNTINFIGLVDCKTQMGNIMIRRDNAIVHEETKERHLIQIGDHINESNLKCLAVKGDTHVNLNIGSEIST